jgi:hypothetical protein
MAKDIRIEIRPDEIIAAVRKMKKRGRDDFLENLLAATSPEYLASIRETRADHRAGRTQTHEELFGD